jgi:hypothetical protein
MPESTHGSGEAIASGLQQGKKYRIDDQDLEIWLEELYPDGKPKEQYTRATIEQLVQLIKNKQIGDD